MGKLVAVIEKNGHNASQHVHDSAKKTQYSQLLSKIKNEKIRQPSFHLPDT